MHRLIEIGFQQAGHWQLVEGRLVVELTRLATEKNILYAFICDGEVKYVGKTVSTLATRLAGYRNPAPSQTTNVRNNQRIRAVLASDGTVDIYALPDNGLLHYGAFHLNLAAGLEDDLIRVLNPEWNGGRAEPVVATEKQAEPPVPLEVAMDGVKESFAVVLHPTYFNSGFFNVRVGDGALLGGDGETIEIYVYTRSRPILGTINRTANLNGTPRIMGGTTLRSWFQDNAAVNDTIKVDVLSPTAIQLRAPGQAGPTDY